MGTGLDYRTKHKLSDTDIDVDKDWAAKKIENLGVPDSNDDAARKDTAAVIDLNKVKLPTPEASDYVTPSAALASSEGQEPGAHTEIGDNSSTPGMSVNRLEAYPITLGASTICYLGINISVQAGQKIRLALYDDDAGNPGALQCESAEFTLIATGWVVLPVTATAIGAGDYWIAVNSDGTPVAYGFATGPGRGRVFAFGAFPDPAVATNDYTAGFNMRAYVALALSASRTKDDNTATQWRPDPVNEANAWCRWDMGALKITSGCRIYWGADANYRPTAYRIEVSEDGATWTTVKTETADPGASAWKEYSWYARYARYIRMIVDTHGATGTEVFEADYYSRITDRVASEHGHGSGITPHLEVKYSEGHPKMERGETLKGKVKDLPTLLEYLDILLDAQVGEEQVKAVKADYDGLKARVETLEKK